METIIKNVVYTVFGVATLAIVVTSCSTNSNTNANNTAAPNSVSPSTAAAPTQPEAIHAPGN